MLFVSKSKTDQSGQGAFVLLSMCDEDEVNRQLRRRVLGRHNSRTCPRAQAPRAALQAHKSQSVKTYSR
jgi:hypothetical protein